MGGSNGDGTAQTRGTSGTAIKTVTPATCTTVNGIDATGSGLCAQATKDGATALGSNAQALDTNTTAVGFRALASSSGAVAIGYNAQATGDPTVAIGSNSVAAGNNSVAMGAGAQAIANNAVALGAGSVADQDNTVSVGAPGSERRITNVAPGVNATDAVNVSQLNNLQNQVGSVQRIAYSGVAMAGALAGLPQVDAGKTFSLGAGIGSYGGYGALAIGASARIRENTIVKFGVSTTSASHTLINAGIGYSW
ncbi:Type IV fimbrial biogenesis protein PilY1 [Collimonas arenae]|uniref:Type IV fimbrial biogenesis protein PilY1 n=1 Tax=Collimonas arenae TaxID=279058 RepID=A0A0A1FKF8_9BURK|nr:YadA-like family protein [Collimonas arenae]AIY43372.1 Type IV fimbrial biogenesis protein PilY1 [Collimonas arenae]